MSEPVIKPITGFLYKHTLQKLDPDERAFLLVGAFMGFFAHLEQGIEIALGELLNVRGPRLLVICRNQTFDDKIASLRSLVDLYLSDRDEAKLFDELARRARKYGEHRNVVAHTPFQGSVVSDGVTFFPITASSKLKVRNMDWSHDDFIHHIGNIMEIDNALRAMKERPGWRKVADALHRAN